MYLLILHFLFLSNQIDWLGDLVNIFIYHALVLLEQLN
jgi:hypothetical protein